MTSGDLMNAIQLRLRDKGYKLTAQREAIVGVLLERETGPMSAEDIYMCVKERVPEIGLATVYRTLDLLTELNLAVKRVYGDGVARYTLRLDEREHSRHQLVCGQCGSMREIEDDWLLELERRLEEEYGFHVIDHRLEFTGHYRECPGNVCLNRKPAVL